MQFSIVNGVRSEAAPGLKGVCQGCGKPMTPKCGKIRVWHWSHQGSRTCDPWFEETEWHLSWKGEFPAEWREVIQYASDGEKHIADVKASDGRVIEFQNSRLTDEERYSREVFYKEMVWVLNGRARVRDLPSFEATLRRTDVHQLVFYGYADQCALLRDWNGRPVDVFLDFGFPTLWHIPPNAGGNRVILVSVPRRVFIQMVSESMPFVRVPAEFAKRPLHLRPAPVMRPRRHFRF